MSLKSRLFTSRSDEGHKEMDEGRPVEDKASEIDRPPLDIPTLSEKELEYKAIIHKKLLDLLDLPLIASISPQEARKQIGEVCEGLLNELSLPVNYTTRKLLIEKVNDVISLRTTFPPHIGQPIIPALKLKGQRPVVDAHEI